MKTRLPHIPAWFFLFFQVFSGIHLTAQNIPDYVPPDSLKGWWPFTGNAMDSSGNGINGTVNGASLTTDRFGKNNAAYSFGGSSNSIVFSGNQYQFHKSGEASISLWINLGTLTNFAQQATVLKSSLHTSQDYNRYNMYIRVNTGLVYDYRENNSNMGSNLHTLNIKSNFTKNVWTHVVYTRSSNNRVTRLYINGKFFNSFTDNSPNLPDAVGWLLGDDPVANLDFAGKLDDMGLWSRVLTDCEIYQLYKSGAHSNILAFGKDTLQVCSSDSVLLTAKSGFVSYQWSNGSSGPSVYVNTSRTMSLITTDSIGCKHYDTIFISLNGPVIEISKTDSVSCHGGSDGAVTTRMVRGAPPFTYQWSNGRTNDSIAHVAAGQYTVVVTNGSGCKDTVTSMVGEPLPLRCILLYSDSVSCYGSNDAGAAVQCSGGTQSYMKKWSNGMTGDTLRGVPPGLYTFFLEDMHGCRDSLSLELFEPPAMDAQILDIDSTSCYGMKDGAILGGAAGGSPPYSYLWSGTPPRNTALASGLGSGTYLLKVTDSRGCEDTVSARVQDNNLPITVQIFVKKYVVEGEVIGLTTNLNGPDFTYSWTPVYLFGNQSTLAKPQIRFNASATIAVEVSNNAGCKGTDTAEIIVITPLSKWIPSAFSPNDDNLNDVFGLPEFFEIAELKIFNRWGEMLFQSSAGSPGWDGTYKGVRVEQGMYLYILKARLKDDTREYTDKGMIMVLY